MKNYGAHTAEFFVLRDCEQLIFPVRMIIQHYTCNTRRVYVYMYSITIGIGLYCRSIGVSLLEVCPLQL